MAEVGGRSGVLPTKLRAAMVYLRSAFWFLPTIIVVAVTVLAWAALGLDELLGTDARSGLFYEGGPDGARTVLGTIAASMITVGTTVFSITLVVLQLASSQFGPRILTNFVSDRGNQTTMGVFIGVFWYCLLVVRQIGSGRDGLPYIAVTTAMVLAAVAVGVLIWFIHHIVRTIQVMNIIQVIAGDLEARIGLLFPDLDAEQGLQAGRHEELPEVVGEGHGIRSEANGYVRLVDLETLVELAGQHDLLVRLDTRPGEFVVGSTPVMRAWGTDGSAATPDDEVCRALARCLYAGAQRSHEQDVEFPARQLVEVAVRALSPAINDPITAAACVHHLGAALCQLAGRPMPPEVVADAEGTPRLVIGEPVTFGRLVGVWYDQIRQNAGQHAYVYLQMLETLGDVVSCSDAESRWGALREQGRLVAERAGQALPQETDRAAVQQRYDALVARIDRARREREPTSRG